MQNVEFELEGDQLIIRIDLSQELGVSSSGKSAIIATTGGNVTVPGWEAVKVGLNVYRPQPAGHTGPRLARQRWEVQWMRNARGIWLVLLPVESLWSLYLQQPWHWALPRL